MPTGSPTPASLSASAPMRKGAAPRSAISRPAPPRMHGTWPSSRPSSGTSTRPSSPRAPTSGSTRSSTGPSSTSGSTSPARGSPPSRSEERRVFRSAARVLEPVQDRVRPGHPRPDPPAPRLDRAQRLGVHRPRGDPHRLDRKSVVSSDLPPEFWNQYKTEFAPGTHVRIHPLLDWTELNVWEYIAREGIPTVSLYYNHGDGTRYRSLGCAPCTRPVRSDARNPQEIVEELRGGQFARTAERAGRAQDAEDGGGLETLRREGYM